MVVAQNHAEKIDPADYNPVERPEKRPEKLKKRHKRSKKHQKKYHLPRGQRLIFTSLVLVVFITGMLIAYFYAQIFSMGYKMNILEKELSEIEANTENLNIEINKLSSLERVEVMAIKKLGMVEPGREIVMVDTDLVKNNTLLEPDRSKETLEEQFTTNSELLKKEEMESAKENKNWVIQAFTKLVSQLPVRYPL